MGEHFLKEQSVFEAKLGTISHEKSEYENNIKVLNDKINAVEQSNAKQKKEIILLSEEKKSQRTNILESLSQIKQFRDSEITLKKRIQSLEMSLNTQTKANANYDKERLALEKKLNKISDENSALLMKLNSTNEKIQKIK